MSTATEKGTHRIVGFARSSKFFKIRMAVILTAVILLFVKRDGLLLPAFIVVWQLSSLFFEYREFLKREHR